MQKVVVFDLDDTLVKEIDFLQSAYREIASFLEVQYALSGVYDYMWECYSTGLNTFSRLNDKFGVNVPLDFYLQMYRTHRPHLSLSPDTQATLEEFVRQGTVLGLITDGRFLTQMNKIYALGLHVFIPNDNIIISETFGCAKPNPNAFLHFEQVYADASFCYIGDNPTKDFIAPNHLGWTTVCLLDDGRNIHKQQFNGGVGDPKYRISNIKEAIDVVK
jgi:putative hydrolase of the HAD superfamily